MKLRKLSLTFLIGILIIYVVVALYNIFAGVSREGNYVIINVTLFSISTTGAILFFLIFLIIGIYTIFKSPSVKRYFERKRKMCEMKNGEWTFHGCKIPKK